MPPIRACLVTGEYPPDEGGVADYTRCLAEALAAIGVTVDVLTTRRRGAVDVGRDAPDETTSRVTVHRVVRDWSWGALGASRRAVRVLRPDVVHVQYQAAAFQMRPAIHVLPWWVGRGRGPRTAVTYHDLRAPYLFPKAGRLRAAAVLALANRSDLTVATNEADYAALVERAHPARLALVPIGSNLTDSPPPDYDRDAWRSDEGLGPGSVLVAYFGFLNESKGGLTLADALARLAAAGRDARLVMIGGAVGASDPTNAAYLARFRADLDARGLAGRVTWTGHLPAPEVSAWLRAADVAALPYADGASYRRGSLLAALTHGVPVVTTVPAAAPTGVPGDERLPPLEDGRDARLVPPGDGASLAGAIGEVVDDPRLAARLSDGARAVAEHFGWPAIGARHAALYREIVGGIAEDIAP